MPEILPLINHKSIGNEIIQIGGENCGACCDAIIEFLRTGKVKVVEPSGKMTYNALRAKFGGGHFQPLTSPERLKVLVKDEQIVIIHGIWEAIPMRNSRGIIEYSTDGHFFIGVRRGQDIHLFDGQTGEYLKFIPGKSYGDFIKTKRNLGIPADRGGGLKFLVVR